MEKSVFSSVFGVAVLVSSVLGEGYYNVIGPRIIRPNSEYHCAISIQDTSEPTSVTAILQGTSHNGIRFYTQDIVSVLPYGSKICTLPVNDLDDGNYILQVRGTGGVNFDTEFQLQYVQKSYSVLVQTDRQVYPPGSKILFRAIALNSELKPAAEVRNEPLDIFISDGSGNKVKEWKKVVVTNGVFTGELKLSHSPVLGNWNISVAIHGQTYNKTIEVAEYIYQKFIVDISAPKHVTFKDNKIPIKIDTRLNYGKKIQGEATIAVYPTIYSGVIQPIFQNPIRKVVDIDGTATVDIDIERDLLLNDEYERIVIVDVTVEEHPTGRRQNNSVEVHIHKYDYQMDLIKTADYFKPGLKYTAYVKITNHDGTPVTSDKAEVTVRHGYSRVDEVYEENKYNLDKNGMIMLEYVTPVNVTNTTALRIEAEFRGLKERISPIPAAVSFSNTFVKVSLESNRPAINGEVDVLVNSTEPMRNINYVLMGRGDVLITNSFRVDNMKEYRFSFRVGHAMVPVCHLIVYYVKTDGEFVGDALDIEVDGLLQNNMDVQVNTYDSEPNLDVEFLITSKPNSYIGFLAVDDNVAALRDGYDLTMKTIAEELKLYDIANGTPYPHFSKVKKQLTWNPGASNPHSAVYESGADLLTNAHVNRLVPTLEDIYLRPVFYGPSTIKPDRGLALPVLSVTRPPLAGPYAFSRIPRPIWNKPKVYLTNDIADTWLFNNFSASYDGKTSLRRKLPGDLTTWSITGFSLDPLFGLGVTTAPKKLKVTKSFEVTLDLPYSVQRGEILAVPVVVHNYLNQDISVDVTLHNREVKFDYAEVSNAVDANETKVELYRRKRLNVKKNTGASVSFMITATKIGYTEIKVTAQSSQNQDMIMKDLLVVPEGDTEYFTKSVLIDLRGNKNLDASINFSIPANAVPGSEKVEVSVVDNFLASAMKNLDNLIRLTTGCGEQNLVHFMPDLVILQYFRVTRQQIISKESEALQNLETSYQQQLSYKRPDGSFSPFGSRDSVGSIWLTAYTALALRQAKSYIYIDDNIIDQAMDWLVRQQGTNGSFYETGNIIYSDLQNRDGTSLPLTAFVTMAFLESGQRNDPRIGNVINKGLDYIAKNIEESDSVYSLSLCGYALQLAGHTAKQSVINLLDLKSKTKDNMKWWAKDVPQNEAKNPWTKLPRSIDIETTSYVLLMFVEAGLLDQAVPVLEWLANQQNSLGGFTSSHDTVVGLHALYKLVTRLATPTNIHIEYEDDKQNTGKFSVTRSNMMMVQSAEISKNARVVNITAQGTGLAVFQVSYQYNKNVTGPWPMFTLDPQVDKNSNQNHLQISICTGFVSRNLSDSTESNMAVMEVNLPSGFTADIDSLPSLEVSQNVQKVETSHGNTKVILYFNNVTREEYCPTISAFRTHKVAKQKPVPVIVYDYYDTSRRARVFYKGFTATLCDICEGEDCGDICSREAEAQSQQTNPNTASSCTPVSLWVLIISIYAMFC